MGLTRFRALRWPMYLFGALLLVGLALYGIGGYRWNHSTSMPYGLYQLTSEPYARGDIVFTCFPEPAARLAKERGYLGWGLCPGGTEPLFKRVLALSSDAVTLTAKELTVNGTVIPFARIERDANNRQMPHANLSAHGVWVGSTYNRNSYDSRYFGAIDPDLIKSKAVAIWTL